jgi:hypothetical protein
LGQIRVVLSLVKILQVHICRCKLPRDLITRANARSISLEEARLCCRGTYICVSEKFRAFLSLRFLNIQGYSLCVEALVALLDEFIPNSLLLFVFLTLKFELNGVDWLY